MDGFQPTATYCANGNRCFGAETGRHGCRRTKRNWPEAFSVNLGRTRVAWTGDDGDVFGERVLGRGVWGWTCRLPQMSQAALSTLFCFNQARRNAQRCGSVRDASTRMVRDALLDSSPEGADHGPHINRTDLGCQVQLHAHWRTVQPRATYLAYDCIVRNTPVGVADRARGFNEGATEEAAIRLQGSRHPRDCLPPFRLTAELRLALADWLGLLRMWRQLQCRGHTGAKQKETALPAKPGEQWCGS